MQIEQFLNENEVDSTTNERNVQAPMLANWGCIMFVITSIPLTKLAEVHNYLILIYNKCRILQIILAKFAPDCGAGFRICGLWHCFPLLSFSHQK